MSRAGTALATLCVVVIISASTAESQRQQLQRILADKPWIRALHLWQRAPRTQDLPPRTQDLPPRTQDLPPRTQDLPPRTQDLPPRTQDLPLHSQDLPLSSQDFPPRSQEDQAPAEDVEDSDYRGNDDDDLRPSEKRSAVATALNTGRRRRQPPPAMGHVSKSAGKMTGALNDVDGFFDLLRDNLAALVWLTPQERASIFADNPRVVSAPSKNSMGGGLGFRNLYALRPLKPTGDIRSYNRRSYDKVDAVYPAANRHDPALLWTGLGR